MSREATKNMKKIGLARVLAIGGGVVFFSAAMRADKTTQGDLTKASMAVAAGLSTLSALSQVLEDKKPSLRFPQKAHHAIGVVVSISMLSAVVLMWMGAIKDAANHSSDDALPKAIIIAMFLYHVLGGLAANIAKLCGVRPTMQAKLELNAESPGLVASFGFLSLQVLAFIEAQKKNNHDAMEVSALIAVASMGFIFATGAGTVLAVQAIRQDATAVGSREALLNGESEQQAGYEAAAALTV